MDYPVHKISLSYFLLQTYESPDVEMNFLRYDKKLRKTSHLVLDYVHTYNLIWPFSKKGEEDLAEILKKIDLSTALLLFKDTRARIQNQLWSILEILNECDWKTLGRPNEQQTWYQRQRSAYSPLPALLLDIKSITAP
ncbi:hypothetical protein Y032_0077g1079 [Ancylostoma ceylanicum]|uniref:Uncharacterized protein n=1 Tax=Ancylostoma ceylanicum TaxID=53326 RepID=A0A016TU80_9BILA|nr:hypothetical protein Y032_0077g1079 [Ancylostoma ceylanicum]